ncbi:MAG: tRNA (5-methylaminomethyl-2-thiouridine)(34)-methyltransferase MnmD [Flavobacteriales bacterium]
MILKRKVVMTADGSSSIQIEDWNEGYHSKHGAIQEAQHVFIQNGLNKIQQMKKTVSVLEIGFGTGLNCFLTLIEAQKNNVSIHYAGIEKYPVTVEEWNALNYLEQIKNGSAFQNEYDKIFHANWESTQLVTSSFSLLKKKQDFFDISYDTQYDLIYFDVFGFRVQPDLWSQRMFDHMYKLIRENGILVTYAAKGSVRRALIQAGFKVERLPGPPGKREMLRACKSLS